MVYEINLKRMVVVNSFLKYINFEAILLKFVLSTICKQLHIMEFYWLYFDF